MLILLNLLLGIALSIVAVPALAAPCPTATIATVCVDLTEPSTLVNGQPLTDYQRTNVYIIKNGVALPVIIIPASAATGGGVVSTVINTVACANDTYSATGKGQNTAGESEASNSSSVTKNRLMEPPCVVTAPPLPFGVH